MIMSDFYHYLTPEIVDIIINTEKTSQGIMSRRLFKHCSRCLQSKQFESSGLLNWFILQRLLLLRYLRPFILRGVRYLRTEQTHVQDRWLLVCLFQIAKWLFEQFLFYCTFYLKTRLTALQLYASTNHSSMSVQMQWSLWRYLLSGIKMSFLAALKFSLYCVIPVANFQRETCCIFFLQRRTDGKL